MGIATRMNGTAPPDIALADIDLGAWDFWALDDDLRDGAFATLRREAPISFWPEPVRGLRQRRRALGADRTRRRVLRQPPSGDLQLQPQHHHQRPDAGSLRVLRLDDRARRPAAPAAAVDRQPGVHPESGGAHRDIGPRSGAPAGRRDDRQPPRRQRRGGHRAGRAAAAAGHLRHDGHPRGRPSEDLPLDQRHPRLRRSRSDDRFRRVRAGLDGHRRLRQRAGRGSSRQSPRRSDHQPGGGRGRRRAADLGRGRRRSSSCWRWPATRPPATRSATGWWR